MAAEKGKCIDMNTPSQQVKRKRGRLGKSDSAGNLAVPQGSAGASLPMKGAVISQPPLTAVASQPVPPIVSQTRPALTLSQSAENSVNRTQGRARVRPRGSGNLDMLAYTGEVFTDTTVADFRVHVIHVDSGEGQFQILSLTGSYTVAETGRGRCRTGGFSASLACPDGRVIGGGVVGPLVAASGVQKMSGFH
ncbi:AT-hook motif nuclear-localized protein 11-like [Apium graveolens]|uniref:AT-hook motif nuclear-localized protein 11-like n=1 Tax=Apium graveolens TaxID=4045 RepID=UPI003D7A5E4A